MLERAIDAITRGSKRLSDFFSHTPHDEALERLDAIARRARAMGKRPEDLPDYVRAEQAITQYERAKGPRCGH